MEKLTKNPIIRFNCSPNTSQNSKLNDYLQKAKLVFISGEDQNRYINVVNNSALFNLIVTPYKNGNTIAATCAGVAVICEKYFQVIKN
jgi:cyanophycinase